MCINKSNKFIPSHLSLFHSPARTQPLKCQFVDLYEDGNEWLKWELLAFGAEAESTTYEKHKEHLVEGVCAEYEAALRKLNKHIFNSADRGILEPRMVSHVKKLESYKDEVLTSMFALLKSDLDVREAEEKNR